MSDSYLPDNEPRYILLSLEELAAKKLPHAPTFRKAADEITRLRAELAAVTAGRDRMRKQLEESRQSWERIDKAHSFRVHESEMRLIKIFAIEKENARLRDALKPFAAMMDAEHMLSLVKALDSDLTRCIVKIGDLRRARAALEGVTEPASLWQHKKTGGIYEIVGECQIEATNTPGVLYRNISTGVTWTRPKEEFFDGRFVEWRKPEPPR